MLQNTRKWGVADKTRLIEAWEDSTLDELFAMFKSKPRTSILCEAYNILFEATRARSKCLAMIRTKLVESGLHDPRLSKTMKWFHPPS
jgi:hypothetical protein